MGSTHHLLPDVAQKKDKGLTPPALELNRCGANPMEPLAPKVARWLQVQASVRYRAIYC